MVSKKKLGYGFNGFQVPFIPKSRRSARKRGPFKKEAEDGQTCAFELLASLAGKLLQESASSSASSNASEGNHCPTVGQGVFEQERQDQVKPSAMEGIHMGNYAESILKTEVASQNSNQECLPQAETDAILEHSSVSSKSDCWDRAEAEVKSEICKWENKFVNYSNILTEAPNSFGKPYDGNIKNEFKGQEEEGSPGIDGPTLANKCSLKDPDELCVSSHSLVDSKSNDSKSNVKSPFFRESFPNASFSRHGNDNNLGFRDDDENFLRCNKVSTKSKACTSPQLIAHRRVRKLLTSKYWKAAPKLKDCELSRSDIGVTPLYCKRKTCYNFGRRQDDNLSKRRKFFDRCSVVTSDGGFSSESVSNSPEKGMGGCNPSSSAKLHLSKDSHVNFSIKSFKIPELYIEVPKAATVGSLKRTVMEAVMAIIGGGVHVGVLLQGKKVRDDNKTLLQTGISSKGNIDTLSFMLEPSSLDASPAVCNGDPFQCETSQPTRSPIAAVLDSGTTDNLRDSSFLTNTGNPVESNNESISSQTDSLVDNRTPDSRALVPVPARSTEPLAMTPMAQKTRRSDLVQRRTRRPFSVSEVEALVLAVEELGTGRWRDVKLRSFENADHRTYVDLKDKWKTLVHTARISPQQRRGEPVPQELLDRVLAAHAYWSQHQAKQNGKQSASTMKITEDSSGEKQSVEAIQPLMTMM